MQYPHCDPKVIHAPGECGVCDECPELQQVRVYWGINFTGYSELDKLPCPAEIARPLKTIYKWHGNRHTEKVCKPPHLTTT